MEICALSVRSHIQCLIRHLVSQVLCLRQYFHRCPFLPQAQQKPIDLTECCLGNVGESCAAGKYSLVASINVVDCRSETGDPLVRTGQHFGLIPIFCFLFPEGHVFGLPDFLTLVRVTDNRNLSCVHLQYSNQLQICPPSLSTYYHLYW